MYRHACRFIIIIIIIIVIIFVQAADKRYTKMGATLDSEQEVVFEADEITLDIPLTGKTIKKSWKIVPLIKNKVLCLF